MRRVEILLESQHCPFGGGLPVNIQDLVQDVEIADAFLQFLWQETGKACERRDLRQLRKLTPALLSLQDPAESLARSLANGKSEGESAIVDVEEAIGNVEEDVVQSQPNLPFSTEGVVVGVADKVPPEERAFVALQIEMTHFTPVQATRRNASNGLSMSKYRVIILECLLEFPNPVTLVKIQDFVWNTAKDSFTEEELSSNRVYENGYSYPKWKAKVSAALTSLIKKGLVNKTSQGLAYSLTTKAKPRAAKPKP